MSTAPGKSIMTTSQYVTCWVAQMGLNGFKIKEGHKVKWEGRSEKSWEGLDMTETYYIKYPEN